MCIVSISVSQVLEFLQINSILDEQRLLLKLLEYFFHFLKFCPIFVDLALCLFTKYIYLTNSYPPKKKTPCYLIIFNSLSLF